MVQKMRHKLSFSVVWWNSATAPRQLFANFCNLNDLHPSRNSPAEAARCQRASCQRLTHLRKFPKFQKKENKSNTLIHSASARLGIHTARIFLPWSQPQMIEFCWHLTKIKDVLLNLVVQLLIARFVLTSLQGNAVCHVRKGLYDMFIKFYRMSL